MNDELKFWPILDHIPPEAQGFSIEVDNCQKSFELLAKEKYVDFGGYAPYKQHFIYRSGYHLFNTKGCYSHGYRVLDDIDRSRYPVFTLTEFLKICDSPEGGFSQELGLADILQEEK